MILSEDFFSLALTLVKSMHLLVISTRLHAALFGANGDVHGSRVHSLYAQRECSTDGFWCLLNNLSIPFGCNGVCTKLIRYSPLVRWQGVLRHWLSSTPISVACVGSFLTSTATKLGLGTVVQWHFLFWEFTLPLVDNFASYATMVAATVVCSSTW